MREVNVLMMCRPTSPYSLVVSFCACLQITVGVLLVLGVAVCVSADKDAVVLRQDSEVNPDGTYQYAYETSNGIAAAEQGTLKNVGDEQAQVRRRLNPTIGTSFIISAVGLPQNVGRTRPVLVHGSGG